MRITSVVALLAITTLGTSCKTARSAETAPPGDAGGAAEELGAPDLPWAQKTRQQRMEYMGLVVLPRMKQVFQAYDAEAFAEFECQTCHGDDMDDVEHRMPNALFDLSASDPVKSATDYDEQVAKFMMEQVVPVMAELLDKQPGKELGCLTCHPSAEG